LRQKDGKEAIIARFAAATCRRCPARDKCTTATRTGRQLFLRPREIHQAVAAARAAQDTRHWKDTYKTRAGIEGTIAQSACAAGIRRARYHGLDKTRLEHLAAATAINVIRLDAWYNGNPIDRGKTTCLQRGGPPGPPARTHPRTTGGTCQVYPGAEFSAHARPASDLRLVVLVRMVLY
jgi:Transposase DDE domain